MSDNFDRKVCHEFTAVNSTQLDNANLGQPITKKCLILFSLWCQISN